MRLVALGFPFGFERRKPDFSMVGGVYWTCDHKEELT